MAFNAVGTLEAGTIYRIGARDGHQQVADRDVLGVVWVESHDDYDVFLMPDGARIFVEYERPKDDS